MNVTTVVEGSPRQFICRTSASHPRPIVSADFNPLEERGEFDGSIVQLVKTIGLDKQLKDYHTKILSCEAKNPETDHVVDDSTILNIIC
jgi:hypothetical protein